MFIVFTDENTAVEVEHRAQNATLTLIGFFNQCAKSEDTRQYLYQEFPQHYVWDKKKFWRPRQRDSALGRIYCAPLKSGERFYL